MSNRCCILRSKNCMFRPVVAIIRFYHSTRSSLFYTIRVVACLMRRSQHQNPCWSIVPLYWVATYTLFSDWEYQWQTLHHHEFKQWF